MSFLPSLPIVPKRVVKLPGMFKVLESGAHLHIPGPLHQRAYCCAFNCRTTYCLVSSCKGAEWVAPGQEVSSASWGKLVLIHYRKNVGEVGVASDKCVPADMVKMCAAFVSELCEATLGATPPLIIDGAVDTRFA